MDAQISKALMGVFMKATQVEAAVTDLILAANANCSTTNSEEKQLSDLFEFLGITYDAGKAKTMGGTPCFNGPEGVRQRLFPVEASTLPVDTIWLRMISFQPVAAGLYATVHTRLFSTTLWFCAGHKKLSVIGLLATGIFRSTVANRCAGHAGAAATAIVAEGGASPPSETGSARNHTLRKPKATR
jgi:hypothetical protein